MRNRRRKHYREAKRSSFRLRYLLWLMVLGGFIFIVTQSATRETVARYVQPWITKIHTKKAAAETTHSATLQKTATKEEPDIQFEFYTALPKMKIEAGDT